MVNVFALSAEEREFDSRSDCTKNYETDISCFFLYELSTKE